MLKWIKKLFEPPYIQEPAIERIKAKYTKDECSYKCTCQKKVILKPIEPDTSIWDELSDEEWEQIKQKERTVRTIANNEERTRIASQNK